MPTKSAARQRVKAPKAVQKGRLTRLTSAQLNTYSALLLLSQYDQSGNQFRSHARRDDRSIQKLESLSTQLFEDIVTNLLLQEVAAAEIAKVAGVPYTRVLKIRRALKAKGRKLTYHR